VKLDGWQAELLSNISVLDCTGILQAHATDTLSHVTGRRDGRTASKSFELDIDNLARGLIDLDLQLHDITASGSTNKSSADKGVRLVEGADVTGMLIVVNDLYRRGGRQRDIEKGRKSQ